MEKMLAGPSASLFSSDIYTYLWDANVDRSTIRAQIVKSFSSELTDIEKQNILDLQQLPKSKNLFFSISHSPAGSGFVAHKNPIGFDIEKINRTQKHSLINRISTSQEKELFDKNWFLIWSMKEAAFKNLFQKSTDIKTLSQIKVEKVYSNNTYELKADLSYKNVTLLSQCRWDANKIFCIAL